MDEIVEQMIYLNKKDLWDVAGILLPILLTIVIIIQNKMYSKRTDDLQKRIHNIEQKNQYHDDILRIYGTFYQFCDEIIGSGFAHNVKCWDINSAYKQIDKVNFLRLSIGRNLDLAKLIFGKSNQELFDIIDTRIKLETEIIDGYLKYINDGVFSAVATKAWAAVVPVNEFSPITKYDYNQLMQVPNKYEVFLKMCESDEIKEIEKMTEDLIKKHEYDNYDKYFEEFFSLNEL